MERRKYVFVKKKEKKRGSCEGTRFHLLSHETSSVEKFSQLYIFPSCVNVLVSLRIFLFKFFTYHEFAIENYDSLKTFKDSKHLSHWAFIINTKKFSLFSSYSLLYIARNIFRSKLFTKFYHFSSSRFFNFHCIFPKTFR